MESTTFFPKNTSVSVVKRIIIVGGGGSEKTKLCKAIMAKGKFPLNVKYTTRPPKDGEIHGKDYNFMSEYAFNTMAQCGALKQYKNGMDDDRDVKPWFYGTSHMYWRWTKIFIMSPQDLRCVPDDGGLNEEDLLESHIVYVDTPRCVRKALLCNKYGLSEKDAERRLLEDLLEFADFRRYDYVITDPRKLDADDVVDTLVSILKTT